MNKDVLQRIIIATLLVLLLVALYLPLSIVIASARFFESGLDDAPGDAEFFNKTGTYKIDANTILEAIDLNQASVFLPNEFVLKDSITNDTLSWGQVEYLKVASAFFEFVWKESLDHDWSIYKIAFDTSCKENPTDFESASFVFYQLIFQHGQLEYNARAITISPLDGNITWGGDNVFRRPFFGINVVDLNEIKISADEALNVAEENGGKTMRQSVRNDCDLYLVFHGDWKIIYDPNGKDYPTFRVKVDPYTGEIISSP